MMRWWRPGTARATVPGSPGTPQPPTRVFAEDFESPRGPLPVRLDQFTGTDGMTYTADPAWLRNCNGWVAAYSDPPGGDSAVAPQVADCTPRTGGPGTPGATAWNRVRQLSQALGVLNGSADPNANHAVSAYTNGADNDGNPGADKVEFQTARPIPISARGNDHAFDDIRLLDVTPQLDKQFSPETTHVNGASKLTFTITNTDDLLAKKGWSFTDTLPDGLKLADPADAATDCPAGKVTAGNGGSTISIADGALAAGQDACHVTVNVTSATPGSYTNDASDITDSTGLNPPGPATVRFEPGAITVKKSAAPATYSADGQTIHYTYHVTNSGTVPLSGVGVTDKRSGLSAVSCPGTTLAPGASMDCTATYRTTQRDVDRGSIHNVATAHGTPPDATEPVVSGPSATTVRARHKPGISVRKSVRPHTYRRAGQVLHYRFVVTNTGNVTLSRVRINDRKHGLSAIRCPRTTLAPGAKMTCTATYRITHKDLRTRVVRNRAVAQGRPPGARSPVRSRPSIARAYGNVPVTG